MPQTAGWISISRALLDKIVTKSGINSLAGYRDDGFLHPDERRMHIYAISSADTVNRAKNQNVKILRKKQKKKNCLEITYGYIIPP